MKSNLAKKTLNVVLIAALAMPMAACSKSTGAKKAKNSAESERRRPKDNVFIENGGYGKGAKVNPFVADEPVAVAPKQNVIVPVEKDKGVEKVAMVDYPSKGRSKGNIIKTFAKKIASIFSGGRKDVMVASVTGVRRPTVNDMVVKGVYKPDHSALMQVAQGSNDEDDAYNWAPIQENVYQPTESSTVLDRIDVGANDPIIKAAVLSEKRPISRVHSKPKAQVERPIFAAEIGQEKVLEQQFSSVIDDFLNVSGSLCGINVEGAVGNDLVSIPVISDNDLYAKNIVAPNLADIPNVPQELA